MEESSLDTDFENEKSFTAGISQSIQLNKP